MVKEIRTQLPYDVYKEVRKTADEEGVPFDWVLCRLLSEKLWLPNN